LPACEDCVATNCVPAVEACTGIPLSQ
jgi:hypothetical protein